MIFENLCRLNKTVYFSLCAWGGGHTAWGSLLAGLRVQAGDVGEPPAARPSLGWGAAAPLWLKWRGAGCDVDGASDFPPGLGSRVQGPDFSKMS